MEQEDKPVETHALNDEWVLWAHEIKEKDWSINSYKKIYRFATIEDFWKLYNNFQLLGGIHNRDYFLFRKEINPLWEDLNNRNGGMCSIQIPPSKASKLWADISMFTVGETLIANPLDITGISISSKSICTIVKIWNRDHTRDIVSELPKYITDTYKKCSIKYKPNKPEY